MRDEKTEKTQVWKTKAQIWGEHGLQRPTNPPKVCYFEPTLASRPHGDNYDDHAPITQLQRQHLSPGNDAVTPDENQIADIVEDEHCGESGNYCTFDTQRFRAAHDGSKRKRQGDC